MNTLPEYFEWSKTVSKPQEIEWLFIDQLNALIVN